MKIPCFSLPARAKLLLALTAGLFPLINARADYQSTVLGDHPVGYWSLDLNDPAAAGGVATDLSGNNNNGSYINIASGNNVTGPSAYLPNGVSFDGASTFVDLSGGGNLALLNFGGKITMEAWVQAASPTAGGYVMGKGYDASQGNNEIEMRLDSGNYHAGTYNQTAGNQGVSGGVEVTDWVHLVSTYDGTNWHLYVNGALVSTVADAVGAINFTDPWAIGDGTMDGHTRILNGNLSQVALYTSALTPAQILTHYFIGLDGTTNVPPVISRQPASRAASPGQTVTFGYQVESLLWLTNQWYKDGVALPNQTNATLVLTGVQTNNAGDYRVVIGNAAGSTTSDAANLNVVTLAAYMVWQTPQVISGTADVLTNGTYFGSWAPYNGGASSLPVNGVAFQGYSDLSGLGSSFDGGYGGGPYFSSPGTADANYNTLLTYGQYSNGGGSSTFSWGGLTPGKTYEVQFWVNDGRGYNNRWENLSAGVIGGTAYGTDSSDAVGYCSPIFSGGATPGYYIVGTFVADASGAEEILLTPWNASGGSSAQVNLFQVRDITVVAPPPPVITGIHLSGTSLMITGTNGTAGTQFATLTSTDVALPLSQWTPIATNTFTGGSFSVTNPVNPAAPHNFYLLKIQ